MMAGPLHYKIVLDVCRDKTGEHGVLGTDCSRDLANQVCHDLLSHAQCPPYAVCRPGCACYRLPTWPSPRCLGLSMPGSLTASSNNEQPSCISTTKNPCTLSDRPTERPLQTKLH